MKNAEGTRVTAKQAENAEFAEKWMGWRIAE